MGIAAGVEPHIKNNGFRALGQKIFHLGNAFLGTAAVEVGDLHQADLIGNHPSDCHLGLNGAPLDGKGQFLPVPQHRNIHKGALRAKDNIPAFAQLQLPHFLAVGLGEDISRQQPRLFRGAAGGNLPDIIPQTVLPFLDGNADAHIAVVGFVLIGCIVCGGHIVAPPVAHGLDHAHGGAVLQRGIAHLVNINVFFMDQRAQLIQLIRLSAGIQQDCRGCRSSQRRRQKIR